MLKLAGCLAVAALAGAVAGVIWWLYENEDGDGLNVYVEHDPESYGW